jgi:hypothetical protein
LHNQSLVRQFQVRPFYTLYALFCQTSLRFFWLNIMNQHQLFTYN